MSTRTAAITLGILAGCGGAGASPDAVPGDGAAVDGAPGPDAFAGDPLAGIGEVELVAGGFQFVEGPQWRAAEGDLLFTDIPASTIHRHVPGGGVTVFRAPSDQANGLALDPQGRLLAAEHGARRVSRTEGDAVVEVVADLDGLRLNSPNDLVVRGDGTIYFTDPPYGIDDADRELGFMGVFRLPPGGPLVAERTGGLDERPNGVGLSPAQDALYVADTAAAVVRAFPVSAGGPDDGALGEPTTLVPSILNPDGLAIDAAGNLFVTAADGVRVYAPDGTPWGTIAVPEQPANCAFGDADARTLYITARTSLYRVRLAHPGLPTR